MESARGEGGGRGSVRMMAVSLSPFVVLIGLAAVEGAGTTWVGDSRHGRSSGRTRISAGAVSVTLWNYMGWDNASTMAQEVEEPQRNYPRAMLMVGGAGGDVVYMLPLAAVGLAGIPAERFSTGAWADAARLLGGRGWRCAVVLAGIARRAGDVQRADDELLTRLPYALAEDGLLPKCLTQTIGEGVPWVSVLVCSGAWALALRLSFERLISIDLVLYGAALMLEFVALVVLRVREPGLPRPFRVPGGLWGAVVVGSGRRC